MSIDFSKQRSPEQLAHEIVNDSTILVRRVEMEKLAWQYLQLLKARSAPSEKAPTACWRCKLPMLEGRMCSASGYSLTCASNDKLDLPFWKVRAKYIIDGVLTGHHFDSVVLAKLWLLSLSATGRRASEPMADAVRGVLQILRNKPGATFKDVRHHCELRGDDISGWPDWIRDGEGYVTEQGAAMMLYEIMRAVDSRNET